MNLQPFLANLSLKNNLIPRAFLPRNGAFPKGKTLVNKVELRIANLIIALKNILRLFQKKIDRRVS